jgi:hypothetical protein
MTSSKTDEPTTLADLFRGDPRVVITAAGRVIPAQCLLCTHFRKPDDMYSDWNGRMPPYVWDHDAAQKLVKMSDPAKPSSAYAEGNKVFPSRLPPNVFRTTFAPFGECRVSGGRTHLLTMMQANPEIKHGTRDSCGQGELSEAAVRAKQQEIAQRRNASGQK